jgi:homoserine O-acetyltransferase
VLEWAVIFPHRVGSIVPIATCAQATAQQIAWGAIGRRAIRLDPNFRGGDYYDAAPGEGPWQGLATARQIAQVTFRSDNAFTEKFGRDLADKDRPLGHDLWQRFGVESYLDYHGEKLVRRFDANSYAVIGKAMDLHDVSRGRSAHMNRALARITSPALVMGISSDILYPVYQQVQIHEALVAAGASSRYVLVESPNGHDGFLIDLDQVGPPLKRFLERPHA